MPFGAAGAVIRPLFRREVTRGRRHTVPAGRVGPGIHVVWAGLSFSWRFTLTGLGWLGGVFVHLQLAEVPDGGSLAALLGAALAGGMLAAGCPRWRLLLVPMAAVLSFALSSVHAAWRLADVLPVHLEREDLVVEGVVASLPQRFEQGVRFRFEVESARHGGEPVHVPAGVQLGWFSGWGGAGGAGHRGQGRGQQPEGSGRRAVHGNPRGRES